MEHFQYLRSDKVARIPTICSPNTIRQLVKLPVAVWSGADVMLTGEAL